MLEYSYHREPTPHLYFPQILPPDVYEEVIFPEIPVRAKGRSGRDLFMGEPGFDDAVHSPGLKEAYELFTSETFVKWVLGIFEPDLVRLHCRATAKDAKLTPFLETREALDLAPDVLDDSADPSEVFNRFDFAVADSSYTTYAHLDSPRRIVGGLLFFSDAEKDHIDGGEFILYGDRLFLGDRVARWPYPAKVVPLKGNTGVLFLNSNRGFHGPRGFRTGTRRWVYYSISSRNQVWQPDRSNVARTTLTKAAGRVVHKVGIGAIPIDPKSKLEANKTAG
jgi:hypothetical protein